MGAAWKKLPGIHILGTVVVWGSAGNPAPMFSTPPNGRNLARMQECGGYLK